ncbi:putative anion transporter 6, chloroplastic [Vitis vinifera]|uniref:Putative anion transporter 6, chloroplastic n=1 Tax=Vitis vinifera TaxID=29760 RepID=A0A438E7P3_VITVI|nr:putative anion transporter 6, chloroplastic [Vitis vinifera]
MESAGEGLNHIYVECPANVGTSSVGGHFDHQAECFRLTMLALEGGGTRHQVWLCMRAAKLAWCHSRDLKASAKVCGLGGMDGRGKGGSVERKGLDLKNVGFGTCLYGMEWAMGGHEGDHVMVVRCERSWPGMCEDVGMGFVECKRYKEVGLVAVMGEEPAGAVMAGESECCYNSNVAPIWVEFIHCWIGPIIFLWGYALSQLPGGWLAKIFGGRGYPQYIAKLSLEPGLNLSVMYASCSPFISCWCRKVLEIGVLTWSLATALVPVLAGFMPGLVLSRILVGIGEGVSPSAATDLIARHSTRVDRGKDTITTKSKRVSNIICRSIPLEERSRAVAFVFGGLSVGSVTGYASLNVVLTRAYNEALLYCGQCLRFEWIHVKS